MNTKMSWMVVGALLAAATADAECSSRSTRDRYLDAETVIFAEIIEANDGPVPYPYGLKEGTVPGKTLTLRVLKSWKGSVNSNGIIHGWARGPSIEDAYLHTDVGSQVLVFYRRDYSQEVYACNTVVPDRITEVSAELDSIVLQQARGGP